MVKKLKEAEMTWPPGKIGSGAEKHAGWHGGIE